MGILIVSALHGVRVETGQSTVYSLVALAGGVAALGFAAGMAAGRMPSPARFSRGDRVTPPGERALITRLRNPSIGLAIGAGIATHLPGLFYLLGLNAIADLRPGFVGGVVDVLIFDLIWLAIPIAALILSIRRPLADETPAGPDPGLDRRPRATAADRGLRRRRPLLHDSRHLHPHRLRF